MGLSIGQVAERTGLSVHALRFYEREGLLAEPIRRNPGGRRVYTEDDVEWLDMCIMLRATGMPLPDVRGYTDLIKEGEGNTAERIALLCRHEQRILAQKAQLDKCLDLVRYKLSCYGDPATPPTHTPATATPPSPSAL
ncbi:MAG TPA: MerR family transcriptional regulator [Streptosporangiaceae bacterium]|jgi:DNA-binding transcriptional MerR regulator|nr:MerR family transcriptional regulator [Streptosporangiaceae bacterium]